MRIAVSLRALGLVSLVTVASGCGADPSTTLRTLGSWAATGAMLGRAWADGATPRVYTARTLDRVKRELVEQERELRRVPAPLRTAATPVTARVGRSMRDLAEAVHAGDRTAARALAESLALDGRRLQQLARGQVGLS